MTAAPTIAQWLAQAQAAGVDRLDAQLLLTHHLQCPRAWLIAHDDEPIPRASRAAIDAALARRAAGVPLAYLSGEREFRGLTLRITPAVLVPRPETELLADWALELVGTRTGTELADLGTGSGALALALKHERPAARVTATDASADALAVARANASRLGLDVEFLQGDWWAPLAGRRFELVVSNPPYIAAGDPHLRALVHEPAMALVSGPDGLDALRRIITEATAHLRGGGWLLLEHGYDQAAAVRDLLSAAGFEAIETRRDLGGQPRTTRGRHRM